MRLTDTSDAASAAFDDSRRCWFVLRDLKRPNATLPAYKMLREQGFEVFTPMRRADAKAGAAKGVCREVPLVQDLVFVHSTKRELDPVVVRTPTLQYRYLRGARHCEPLVLRDSDMERFMRVVSRTPSPRYCLPSELGHAAPGRRVRIVGGPYESCEGSLLTVRGSRSKRLTVSIPGFITVCADVAPEHIQYV